MCIFTYICLCIYIISKYFDRIGSVKFSVSRLETENLPNYFLFIIYIYMYIFIRVYIKYILCVYLCIFICVIQFLNNQIGSVRFDLVSDFKIWNWKLMKLFSVQFRVRFDWFISILNKLLISALLSKFRFWSQALILGRERNTERAHVSMFPSGTIQQ